MRVVCLVAASLAATIAAAQPARAGAPERARVIAALERLMMTGEPWHVDHDEGEWLQAAVLRAIERGDTDIHRLARRAAASLVPRVSRPVSPVHEFPVIAVQVHQGLELPHPVRFRAEIYASIDGGELFLIQVLPRPTEPVKKEYPAYARQPGVHHVRLQARIAYENGGGPELPPETRNLRELAYALYDPAVDAQYDARLFVMSPAWVRASSLDSRLPDVPFESWLATTLAKHGARSDPRRDWVSTPCDERVLEGGLPPGSTTALCAIAYFEANGTMGRLWFRTGRIEFRGSEVRWLAEAPALEAVQLRRSDWTETDTLSALPDLLDAPEQAWPRSDVSIAPEDISVTSGRGLLQISATVRNTGAMDARGVYVMVTAGHAKAKGTMRRFVVDIPAYGEAVVRSTQPTSLPYGVVLILTMQVSEHTPHDSWTPDATPDDSLAFRVFNPQKAPKDYARTMRDQCAPICRGY